MASECNTAVYLPFNIDNILRKSPEDFLDEGCTRHSTGSHLDHDLETLGCYQGIVCLSGILEYINMCLFDKLDKLAFVK